jgi:Zn-dependent protease with chaperone function
MVVAGAGGAVPGLVVGAIVAATVDLWAGLACLVVMTATTAIVVWRRSTAFCLHLIGAVPCRVDEQARLFNLTEGLCATFGLRPPELWIVDDNVPNACALGRSPDDAVLVVTSGVLDTLGLIELEGLVAHELAHVKRGETALAGVGVMLTAPLARLTGRDGWLRLVIGRGREYDADLLAVSTVRYPPGLRDALTLIQGGPVPTAESIFSPRRLVMTRWIWVDPDPGRTGDEPGSIDALGVRIAALAER